jgi:CRP-like cAMP-binding protein
MSYARRRLEGTWLFRDLDPAAIEHLAAHASEVSLEPGQTLIREGEPGDALYVVLSGSLQVTRAEPEGTVILGEVRKGEHLGELALLSGEPRSATATALEPTRALRVTRDGFEECMHDHPAAGSTLGHLAEYRRAWCNVRRVRPPREAVAEAVAKFFPMVPLQTLREVADEVEWVTLPKGAQLFRQGDPGDAVYFVLQGALAVVAERDDGREVRLGHVSPGEAVGEMALLSGEARMAAARALEDCELCKLSRAGFDALIARHPETLAVFARTMAARLARAARGRAAVVQLRASPLVTLGECEAAVTLTDPVLLNLTITQLYHRIAVDLTLLLGAQDVNWFGFACRASKTAGSTIRGEELSLRQVLSGTPVWPLLERAAAASRRFSIVQRLDDLTQTLGERVARGNRFIFEEIGPAFVRLVRTFSQDTEYDREKLERVLGQLQPGPSETGGQDTLKGALAAYYEASFERQPKRRAELVLLGSLKIGLHEQTRVDPILADALDAPLELFFDEVMRALPAPGRLALAAARPVAQRALRRTLTQRMMRMRLPDVELVLGEDVPAHSEASSWPAMLATLEHPEVKQLFDRVAGGAASRARDWSKLDDRMRYIATLFRARQKSLVLFEPPYVTVQDAEIRGGRVPKGPL